MSLLPQTRTTRSIGALGAGPARAPVLVTALGQGGRHATRSGIGRCVRGVLLMGLLLADPLAAEVREAPHQRLQTGAPAVTYAGFQKLGEGRFRLFVRLTQKPELMSTKSGKEATFLFEGARVLVSNNKNPLNFKHFNTSLHRAQLKAVDDGVELALSFKRAVKLEHRFVERADGSATFQVDFPGALMK